MPFGLLGLKLPVLSSVCSKLGAVLHLRQEDGGYKGDKEVAGVDQLYAPTCYKSEKHMLGYKQTMKMIRQVKAKLVILINKCPALRKSEIKYNTTLAKTGVHPYSGNNTELGTLCGKYFRV